jgi:hypothetical protein
VKKLLKSDDDDCDSKIEMNKAQTRKGKAYYVSFAYSFQLEE